MAHLDHEGSSVKLLDEKDRVGLVSEHARVLTQEVVLCPGPSRYIELRDLHTWEAYKALLKAKAAKGSRRHRQLVRHIIGDSRHVKVDGQNRVRLGSELVDWADISPHKADEDRPVKVIGVGDHIEIWSQPYYKSYRKELEGDFEETFDELMMDDVPVDSAEEAPESDGI